jgi:hypothetical protein
MLPNVVLFIAVMGCLVFATRLALARPAHWFLMPEENEIPVALGRPLGNAMGVVFVVLAFLTLSEIPPATPYAALAVIAVLTILFVRSAARSWPLRIAIAAVSATAGAVWILAASWLTYSIAAAFMAIAIITIVRPRLSFWLTATVMAVLAVWDFIQVSVTHATVRAVVAADPFISVATPSTHAAGVPGLIGIAGQATLVSPYAVALGVGDVTLPGILIVIAGRAGQRAGTSRLYVAAVSGYAVGLAACLAVPASVSTALPALVFLIPGVIVAVALTARRAGAWSALASKDLSRPVLSPDALPTLNHQRIGRYRYWGGRGATTDSRSGDGYV